MTDQSLDRPTGAGGSDPAGAARAGEASSEAPAGPQPGRWALTHGEIRTIVLGLMLAMFLAALNQTIVATALPTIGRDFGDFENLSWAVTAYLLTSTAVAPLFGKMSDIYGRRAMLIAGVGVFVVGSVICALAPNLVTLIIGRAVQGLGGGGILPIAQAVMGDAIAPRERGRYQAYMGTMWISAGLAGPVLGGLMAQHFHWSVIFWINVPLGILAGVMLYVNLKRLPRNERRHKLDIVGAVLVMAASAPLLLALSWGGTRYAWSSPVILTLALLAALLSILFVRRLMTADEPLLPLPVLRNPVMRMGTACTAFSQGVAIGLTIYLPLYYELVHGMSASDSGLLLIPLVIMSTPGSILAGRALMHVTHYKRVSIMSLVISILALVYLAWRPDLPALAVALILSVVSFGIGTTYPTATTSIQNAVSRYQVGAAMGGMNFFRALVATFLVAALGAIVLAGIGVAPERGMAAARAGANVVNGADIIGAFRLVFATNAVFLVLSLVALILMEERPLRGRSEPAVQAAE